MQGPRPPDQDPDWGEALGARIRLVRRELGLTMVQLADRAGLSQPFLSQVERGHARPSMGSLHRIARSLGTTTPALLVGAGTTAGTAVRVSLVRAQDGAVARHAGGVTRALVEGHAPQLLPLEFQVEHVDFDDYFSHAAGEFLHVVTGRIEVDLADDGRHVLGAADSLYYGPDVPHRFRRVGARTATVLVVQAVVPPPG